MQLIQHSYGHKNIFASTQTADQHLQMNELSKNKTATQGKELLGNVVTINDLRDKEFNNNRLNDDEAMALNNFDHYRIEVLGKQESEDSFHSKYIELQAQANLTPYTEYLNEKYLKD